jgi:integration host factor subunit alpha
MTKADIVEHIYERVGFSKKESAELVEKVFEIIKETLAEGEKVKISGFGNFIVGRSRITKAEHVGVEDRFSAFARTFTDAAQGTLECHTSNPWR